MTVLSEEKIKTVAKEHWNEHGFYPDLTQLEVNENNDKYEVLFEENSDQEARIWIDEKGEIVGHEEEPAFSEYDHEHSPHLEDV